jgi:hypothetical protein
MQRVDTALLVQAAVAAAADTADLRPALLLVEAAMVDLRKHRRQVVATADRLRVDTAEAVADLGLPPAISVAEDSAAAVADSDRPAVDSLLLAGRWVRAWATTSTRRYPLF